MSSDDLWARIEALRERPFRPIPPELRASPEEIRASIANMTPEERDRMYAEVEDIQRRLRRPPEDVAAIFTFLAGLAAIAASPFVGDVSDDTFLVGTVLLVVTIIGWVAATRMRYRRR
jgi:hypothetical protein